MQGYCVLEYWTPAGTWLHELTREDADTPVGVTVPGIAVGQRPLRARRGSMDTQDGRLGADCVQMLTGCHAEKLLSATIPLGSMQPSPVQSDLCDLCPGIIIHGYMVVVRTRTRTSKSKEAYYGHWTA